MDGFVPLAVMKGTILFYSGKCGVVLDQSRTPDPRLVLDGVDEEPEQDEVLCRLEGLEQTR